MTDRERIEVLERCVRLLAEAARDALKAVRWHDHGDGDPPDQPEARDIDRAIGRLDAVLSGLGVGAPGGAGEGVGDNG